MGFPKIFALFKMIISVCSFDLTELETADFSSSNFTVEVDGVKKRIEKLEDLAQIVPHENDVVSLQCPNTALG